MPGLGTSFGRGGATTSQQDLINADAILIVGSSMAEAHPVGFQWAIKAREKGSLLIHVDPRFSRTSSMADLWVPLRAGSDIAFFGGLINYVLTHDRIFREYVVSYTNAPILVREDYKGPEDLDGFFSGWNDQAKSYDTTSWQYDVNDDGTPKRDETLRHPRTIYQQLIRHFARYTPEMVERVCGIPKDAFLDLADRYTSCSGPEKTATICYAVGLTQHSVGVQIIRSAAILQLLLGNIGRPGGGILALRGHASIQGSTDIPTLYDLLPGYLPMPAFGPESATLPRYIVKNRPATGWWSNFDKYIVSLLKAYYGGAATRENDFGFGWLPRISGDHSHQGYWLDMADGKMEGLFVMGQNPAVGAPNASLERKALAKLKWLVVRDMVELETATFWKDSPEVQSGALVTEEIGTEIFFLPAAGHAEKEGTFTNTQRMLQWHEKAVDPPGDCRSDLWFVYHLGRRLKEKAAQDRSPINDGLRALTWEYVESRTPNENAERGTGNENAKRETRNALGETRNARSDEPDAAAVLSEINGMRVADRSLVSSYTDLAADGSTACGCWIYSGVMPARDRNRANERDPHGPYGHGWGYQWPSDRRILYNRASARPDGTPWSERKKLVWWDADAERWTGLDTPDFPLDRAPGYRLPATGNQEPGKQSFPEAGSRQPAAGSEAGSRKPAAGHGAAVVSGDSPFLLHPDGLGWLFVPNGLKDGPLPAHYEPLESPYENVVYKQQTNPAVNTLDRPDNLWARSPDNALFPHVLTTYRLTEHHTGGGMSRTLSHLAELQPALFCEMSPELAHDLGIRPSDRVRIYTARGHVDAHALVTQRIRPLTVDGRIVHHVALPFHFGHRGLVTGDVTNDLIAMSEEPNVKIMETKALLCRVERI